MTNDWLSLKGQVVIVTGGSSGIGASIVKELLIQGVKVVNADIYGEPSSHENYYFIKADITKRANAQEIVRQTCARFGTIDGLVNNAGINLPRLLVDPSDPHGNYELDDSSFERMIQVNQTGVFLISQEVSRVLAEKKSGVILNVSSESGLEGSEGQSAYAATKAALNSFTRSWAKELGKYAIRVVGVAPGIMEETGLRTLAYETALAYTRDQTITDLRAGYTKLTTIPLRRTGKLSEVADLVCYLLSKRANYITGVTINVAGGKTRG